MSTPVHTQLQAKKETLPLPDRNREQQLSCYLRNPPFIFRNFCFYQGNSPAFEEPFSFLSFLHYFFFFTCLHGFCCCLSFCSTVTPPSCWWCRGPSLSKSLSLQKLSAHHLLQTDSVPDAAPKKLFSCIHCPTRLAVLPGVLALGNTFCLVNHCCRRCHGACFQRCRTDTPMIHPGIKHCTTSMECRSGKNLLGHQVHLPVVTSNHITRSIRKRLIGLSQLMGSLVWQRNKGSKVWKLRLGEVRLATRGYPI